MKKIYLLAVALIAGVIIIASCADDAPINNGQNQAGGGAYAPTDGEPEQAAPEHTIFDVLPERNFDGMTFTVYVPPNPDSPVDKGTFAEELTGDIFNDAIFHRNRRVEEQYNVRIAAVYGANWDSAVGDLRTDVRAGELRADVYFTHVFAGVAAKVSEGLLRTWDAVPHLDFEQPWWNSTIIENLNIANRMFYIAGAMSIQEPLVMLFNKDMILDLHLENPYTLVREGRWTVDKLSEMARAAARDLNGDGIMSPEHDQFGLEFGMSWQTPALMYASNLISVTLDDNGFPHIDLLGERHVRAFERISEMLWDESMTFLYGGDTVEANNIPFMGIDSGRVLFVQWNLFNVHRLRATEIDYGILPLPKLDESQERYLSVSWTGMYGLPAIIDDGRLEMIGIVMESMSALGYTDVIPVYYDIVLKEKFARDEDSREMLDIILNNMVFDLGLNFQTGASHPGFFTAALFRQRGSNYVSSVERQIDRMMADYDRLFQTVLELDN